MTVSCLVNVSALTWRVLKCMGNFPKVKDHAPVW